MDAFLAVPPAEWDLIRVDLETVAGLAADLAEVRGLEFTGRGLLGSGYYLSGATLIATLEKRVALTDRIYLSLDGKVTAGYGRVPVAGGDASVRSLSLHLLSGLGYGSTE